MNTVPATAEFGTIIGDGPLDQDAALREDIRLLGRILGETVRQ